MGDDISRRDVLRADGGQAVGKPFAGFDDFDDCVGQFADDPSVDDPEALCAWLEDQGKDALDDPNADELLTGLEVEFVSAVDVPAQDSEWLIAKNADDPTGETHRWKTDTPIVLAPTGDVDTDVDVVKADEDKQIAFAPVLVPGEADKQGDVIPDHEIEKAAHTYISEYRKVDSDHDLLDGRGTPVESWTLKRPMNFTKPDGDESREYPAGTWIMGIKFDDETWGRVKEGELQGLSIYGGARPIDVDALIDVMGKSADTQDTSDGAESSDSEKSMGDTEETGDDTPNDDDEQVEKQLNAETLSAMLETFGDKVENGLAPDASVEDFVMRLIEDGDVDETQVTGLSVLLGNGGGGGGGSEDDAMPGDDEDAEADAPDNSDVELSGDGEDTDPDGDATDDAEKSASESSDGDDGDRFDELIDRIKELEEKVDESPDADRMESDEAFAERMKSFLGVEDDADDDVVRKAFREQVEKADDDGSLDIGFGGIADEVDEDASGERTNENTDGDADVGQSKSANMRFGD